MGWASSDLTAGAQLAEETGPPPPPGPNGAGRPPGHVAGRGGLPRLEAALDRAGVARAPAESLGELVPAA